VHGSLGLAGKGWAGMVWVAGLDTAWSGKAGEVRLGTARAVQVRHGRHGVAW
jgi:hypothetical protein